MGSFRFGALHVRSSFKLKLITSLSAVILVVFCLSGYMSYRFHLRLFGEEIRKQFHKANEQALARLELHIQSIYRISDYIVFHPIVEDIIKRSSGGSLATSFQQYEARERIGELLSKVKLDAPKLNALYLYDLNGRSVYYDNNASASKLSEADVLEIGKATEGTDGRIVWKRMALASAIEPNGFRNVIVASRLMKTDQLETYGLLVMIFDQTLFSEYLEELTSGEAGKVYLFDQSDQLLYTDDLGGAVDPASLLAMGKTDIRKVGQVSYLFSKSRSDAVSFSLVSRVSLQAVQKNSQIIFRIALYSALVSIVLACMLVMFASDRLLRPLKVLMRGMRRLREGKFDTRIEIRTKDELAYIGQSFNSMAENIDALIKEVYERRLNEREAELKALQAQLNPHFLYNALDTIYWNLYVKDEMETAKLVISLSQMLRYALEPVREWTTVNDEIGQVRNYLHIQSARFKGDLRTSIEIEDEVRDGCMIRFIIQPLVENCFIHAFRDKPTGREIGIWAYRRDGDLIVDVSDNGCGMEAGTIERLLAPDNGAASGGAASSAVSSAAGGGRTSIGIKSVVRRIDLIYGKPYGLAIESRPGAGTTVRLRLPFRTAADADGGQEGGRA